MTQTAKPYRQGFNKETGEILIVFTVGDIQTAVAEREDKTISEAAALEFMETYDNKIVDAMLYEWPLTISEVFAYSDHADAPKETNLND